MAQKAVQETPQQRAYRETVEQIAGNIASLAIAVEKLMNGPLKKKALIVLLASSSGQSQFTVTKVLEALADLQKDWLNK